MSPEIVSVYRKVWSSGFSVSFLHDSANCKHCLSNGIHIAPRIPEKFKTQGYDPPENEDASESLIKEPCLRALVIQNGTLPENCFSPLGIKLTATVINKLKKENKIDVLNNPIIKTELTPPRKVSLREKKPNLMKECTTCCNCDKNQKIAKAKSKNDLCKELYKSILSTVKVPLVKVSPVKVSPKKSKSPNKVQKTPSKTFKEPSKGTLKRKRWQIDRLKKNNPCYEDDLFGDQVFCNLNRDMPDDSESETYESFLTPRISLSPAREGSHTPDYDDCYSPSDYFNNRKGAEEYIFRREKRRKTQLKSEENEDDLNKYKNTEKYTVSTLEETCKVLSKAALRTDDLDSEEERDEYFSDVSD